MAAVPGKTSAQLRACLERASAGERVLFVVSSYRFARNCLDMPVVRSFPGAVVRQTQCRVEIPNAGHVDIVTGDNADRLRGIRAHVEIDHAAGPYVSPGLLSLIAEGCFKPIPSGTAQ